MEPNFEMSGAVMARLANKDFDLGHFRPYIVGNQAYVSINTGKFTHDGKPKKQQLTTNAPALLTREDWLMVDKTVRLQLKERLVVASDIYSKNPIKMNGYNKLAVQFWTGDGDADAVLSMDGMRQSERSRVDMKPVSVPLPLVHSDGGFSARQIAYMQGSNMPLDTTAIRYGTRKIGEVIEKLTLGTSSSYTFGGGTIYGLTNHPYVNSYTMTSPENGGWGPSTMINQLLEMIRILEGYFYYGPYDLYLSRGWGMFLDRDYVANYPKSLRTRLGEIGSIRSVKTVDFLSDYKVILFQNSPEVAQFINGMDVTTIQWAESGGQEQRFKIMGIQVPLIRADYNNHTGIAYGTATAPTTTTTTTTTTTSTTTTTTTTTP